MRLTLIPVAPTGERTVNAHIHYADRPHEWGAVAVDEYPPSPRGEELIRLRLDHATMTRRQVCAALGISPMECSALENGRMTLSDDDWTMALAAVRALVKGGEPCAIPEVNSTAGSERSVR